MSEQNAERFISQNTRDRRDPIVIDSSEDAASGSEYAVVDPATGKTEGVSNRATAEAIAKRRGHHVLIRGTGTYDPMGPPARKSLRHRRPIR